MRNWLLTGMLVMLLTGCKSRNTVPRGVLPPDKMEAVMWDMMRADQFLVDYVFNRDTAKNNKTETLKLYQQVFAIHKIDKETFQQSFAYYQAHPDLLRSIMDSIALQPVETLPPLAPVDTPLIAPVLDTGKRNPGMATPDSVIPKRKPKMVPVN
jgi:Domain of unknown function (DUF4296)